MATTDRRGRPVRWGALAVIAPASAIGLAAATGWAAANPPTSQVAPVGEASPPQQPGAASEDTRQRAGHRDGLARLERQAREERARVVRLQRRLQRIQVRTEALAREPLPGPGSSGAAVPVPPPQPAAGPPATHTSTGAS
jgi:hypothetical protein